MATTTSGNLGLSKPEYTDVADIAVLNGNSDTIDTAVSKMETGLTIYANGNTHAAIASGRYVYVRNHGTLSEGLYKANSAISANASLTSSNLTAVSGALNTLASAIATNATDISTANNNIANLNADITDFTTHTYFGSLSSKASLDSAIDALLTSLDTSSYKTFRFSTSADYDVFRASSAYTGIVYKAGDNTTYSHVVIYGVGFPDEIDGYRAQAGWTYVAVATSKTATAASFYLNDNDDLNDITSPGIYYCNNKTVSNIPYSLTYFHLMVYGIVGTVIQVWINLSGSIVYERGIYSGNVRTWQKINTTAV